MVDDPTYLAALPVDAEPVAWLNPDNGAIAKQLTRNNIEPLYSAATLSTISAERDALRGQLDTIGAEAFTLRNQLQDARKDAAKWLGLHDAVEASLAAETARADRAEDERCELLRRLKALAAEVGGMKAFDREIRAAFGNANWSVLMLRLSDADATITTLTKETSNAVD